MFCVPGTRSAGRGGGVSDERQISGPYRVQARETLFSTQVKTAAALLRHDVTLRFRDLINYWFVLLLLFAYFILRHGFMVTYVVCLSH
jgi:hypothetical protein